MGSGGIRTVKLKNSGFSPDMVIVDYFECLKCKGDASDDKWEKEGKTMRKFESIAGELNVAIWIPVQGTKDSLNAEVVTMDKSGSSFKKIQIAQFKTVWVQVVFEPFNW